MDKYRKSGVQAQACVPVFDEYGEVTGEESDFVFVTQRGGPMTRNALQKRLRRLVDSYRAKVDPDMEYFNIHSLRHMFATRTYEAEHDPKLVSALLGHKSVRTTLDIYTHMTEDSERRLRQIVNKLERK